MGSVCDSSGKVQLLQREILGFSYKIPRFFMSSSEGGFNSGEYI